MKSPSILIFAGSNRSGSYNAQLTGHIARALAAHECTVTRIALRDYPLPLVDEDLEAQKGIPENGLKLARLFHEHDGVVIVTPEYNTSIPPLTKNTIDWVSRVKADSRGKLSPYKHKVFGLASASPGRFGGVRCLFHLRAVIGNCGGLVISEQVCLTFAVKAYAENGEFADDGNRRQIEGFARSMAETTALLKVER
jgi:NAD(P)H-dependent FMN reductase